MAEIYTIKHETLKGIADAIRAKTGATDQIVVSDMAAQIESISTPTELENIEIELDFSNGNQTVNAPDGSTVKSAILIKPETLVPEYISDGVEIAGVVGTLTTSEAEEKTVELDFSSGDMEVTPAAGKAFSKVSIPKPSTLLAENIAEGVNIAGIIGTMAAGGGTGGGGSSSIVASGTETGQFNSVIEWTLLTSGELMLFSTSSFAMLNAYSETTRPSWESYKDQIKTVTFCSTGIINVGNYAFYNYTNLTKVNFSKGISRIEHYAFKGCTALASINFPTSLTFIGQYVFSNCSTLNSAIFDTQSGWKIGTVDNPGQTSVDVTGSATNATNLTSTYVGKVWTRA